MGMELRARFHSAPLPQTMGQIFPTEKDDFLFLAESAAFRQCWREGHRLAKPLAAGRPSIIVYEIYRQKRKTASFRFSF